MKNTLPNPKRGDINIKTTKLPQFSSERKFLLIEKSFFIASVTLLEFYAMLVYTKMQWIANPIILPFLAVPLAIAGILMRRKRKKGKME